VTIKLRVGASALNSEPIDGMARPMDPSIKGVRKAASEVTSKAWSGSVVCELSPISCTSVRAQVFDLLHQLFFADRLGAQTS